MQRSRSRFVIAVVIVIVVVITNDLGPDRPGWKWSTGRILTSRRRTLTSGAFPAPMDTFRLEAISYLTPIRHGWRWGR
jgi:hypothetical protein